MGKLVPGDDNFHVEEVGEQAKKKQELLNRYVQISSGARKKFIGPGKAGAAYIDLFCGPGRSKIKDTSEYIDGCCVAAWRKSVESGSPFSKIYIADVDRNRLTLATRRLTQLNAPVVPIEGPAVETVVKIFELLPPAGLHFAFIDPYSLGALDFQILRTLAQIKRMDILVHLSKMDLQRNLDENLGSHSLAFDKFAPEWRGVINADQAQRGIRTEIIDYWRSLILQLGTEASPEMRLITGLGGQHLYWLLLIANHQLAHRFWKTAANIEKQSDLFS
jgi:three-Cys-motif partner protein